MKSYAKKMLAYFDEKVGKYFTDKDLERGYIEVQIEKELLSSFPLTSFINGSSSSR